MGIDKEGCNHVIIGNGLQEKFSGSSYNKGMGTVVVVSRTSCSSFPLNRLA